MRVYARILCQLNQQCFLCDVLTIFVYNFVFNSCISCFIMHYHEHADKFDSGLPACYHNYQQLKTLIARRVMMNQKTFNRIVFIVLMTLMFVSLASTGRTLFMIILSVKPLQSLCSSPLGTCSLRRVPCVSLSMRGCSLIMIDNI